MHTHVKVLHVSTDSSACMHTHVKVLHAHTCKGVSRKQTCKGASCKHTSSRPLTLCLCACMCACRAHSSESSYDVTLTGLVSWLHVLYYTNHSAIIPELTKGIGIPVRWLRHRSAPPHSSLQSAYLPHPANTRMRTQSYLTRMLASPPPALSLSLSLSLREAR